MDSINPVFTYARKKLPRALSLLPLFVIFSLVAHIGALAVFQIIYPPPATGLRRSAEVYFLKPNSPEAEKLAPWLQAADPALFSRFKSDNPHLLSQPSLEYVPSFDLMRPRIPTLEALPLDPDEKIHLHSARSKSTADQGVPPAPLKVNFSGPLKTRPFAASSEFPLSVSQNETPQNPVFSVAVADDGRPLFVLLEQSSGQTELDMRAREYLLRGRFAPAAQENPTPVWGRATFPWPRPARSTMP